MMPRGLGNLQVWCTLNFSSQNFAIFFCIQGWMDSLYIFRMESESCGFFPTYHDLRAVQES